VSTARALLTALAIASLALVGALPGSRGEPDACALLAWLALTGPAAGALAGGLRLAPWPHAAAVPGAWAMLLVCADAAGARDLPSPAWALLAAAGLFALGFAAGRALPAHARWRAAAAALGVAALLTLLPLAGGLLAAPWPPRLAAALLDLSPLTLLAECAGLDWLRHPAVYAPAGSVDIDPGLRAPYAPALASATAFVVGCAAVAAAELGARRSERRRRQSAPAA
jgi:hypothetical protein